MFRLVLAVLTAWVPLASAEYRLSGRIVDENNAPVEGARILLASAADPNCSPVTAGVNLKGEFSLGVSTPGDYLLDIERTGYFRLVRQPVRIQEPETEITLVLNHERPVFESIDVPAERLEVDPDNTSREQRLSENQILAVPYPTTNSLRNAMRLLPGIVQDGAGGVHIAGGSEDQALYTLDGFNISDPLTGRFESRLSVESVRAVDVSSGRFSPEFGKGSAGAVAIQTSMGDDKVRYSATNFFPGIENHKGLQIGNWTPRANLSGPLARGRAWFSDSIDLQYDRTILDELPKGQNSTVSWRGSNLLRTQVNLSPGNILYVGALANVSTAARTGLGYLTPIETTTDRRARQWFFHVKDQIYFGQGMLIEAGYAANRTFGREIPQGHDLLRNTTEGSLGNAFVNATRFSSRDQWLSNLYLPPFARMGFHRVRFGVDMDRLQYRQNAGRTGYEQYGAANELVRRVVFGGDGTLARSNFEASWFAQDSWRMRPSLLVEFGLRYDWDRLVRNHNLSPRLGFGWSPGGREHTRISGGYAVIYDASNLRLFTRPQDQYSLTTYYAPSGAVERGPAVSVYWIDPARRLRSPRYQEWSLGLEQQLPAGVLLRLDWLRKRGRNGFTYGSILDAGWQPPPELRERFPNAAFDAIYELSNDRRDRFDSLSMVLRKHFSGQYEIMGSYTRSRAFSNAVVDVNVDDPLIVSRNVGPMPWDTPNRVMSWGYLPTPSPKWAVAYLVDLRNGFPFSVFDESGRVIGDINARRLPYYLEADLHLERKIVFHGHRWALRAGCNNLSGRRNPTTVNGNTGSAHFLTYYGGQGRTFNFRIRWLGKVSR